ncbi:glycosyltransferase family 2 protein [Tenacibaculum aestuariivivum]|uniref:glycosyltransferase family 2 protein n=1 Tax=Tenacibaculum aestuariivivum TaxID=2006131 RepID=UPI003AB82908
MQTTKISIIITTYNSTEWLQKVIWGYNQQTYLNFELVIADDGSKKETKELIDVLKTQVSYNIIHVWHKDNGFQKTIILNKAILKSNGDYLIISDGDCIPRKDFVETHAKNSEKGYYLSGAYFKLPMNISELINENHIKSQQCFDINWLTKHGLKKSFKNNKLTAKGLKQKLLNNFTPTRPTWNGANSSGWKKDIIAINGFDERMQYGGLDVELGERLINFGIKPKQIRYSAITIHLDHPRGYANPESWKLNNSIRKHTRTQKVTWTDYGIIKKHQ